MSMRERSDDKLKASACRRKGFLSEHQLELYLDQL